MNTQNLPKIKSKSAKRVGRGPGSGKGKTSTKGQKGQNVRGKLSITHAHYEGGQRPLFKRLPYRRGKGNKSLSKKPLVVNLRDLNKLAQNSKVDLELLITNRIVDRKDAKTFGVKILGDGAIELSLTIALPISKSAAEKIIKAGGKIESQDKKTTAQNQSKKAPTKKSQSKSPTKNSKTEK